MESPRTLAPRRLGAFAADGALAFVGALVVSALFGLFDAQALGFGLALLVGAAYVLLRDGLPLSDERSIGKRAFGLRAIGTDGGPLTRAASVRRNATLALPVAALALTYLLDGLTFYGTASLFGLLLWPATLLALAEAALVFIGRDGRRLGDRLASTRVVEAS